MARNRRYGCAEYGNTFIPWNGCGNTCGVNNGCGNAACGRAFNFNQTCPFLNGCGYPMTFEEMIHLIYNLRYARLAVCCNGTAYVAPVCFSVRTCGEAPIFTLRVRTDGGLIQHLEGNPQVTLQFDRAVDGGVCSVQAHGTAHVTGSTGCVAIIEVHTASMVGECFRNHNCGCAAANGGTGCGNPCGGCGNWNTGCTGGINPCGDTDTQNNPCN